MCISLVRCNELDPAILVFAGAVAVLIVVVPAGIAQVVIAKVEVQNAAQTKCEVIAQDLGGQLRNLNSTADTIAVYTAGNADLQCTSSPGSTNCFGRTRLMGFSSSLVVAAVVAAVVAVVVVTVVAAVDVVVSTVSA